jgi:hypothetical protein
MPKVAKYFNKTSVGREYIFILSFLWRPHLAVIDGIFHCIWELSVVNLGQDCGYTDWVSVVFLSPSR